MKYEDIIACGHREIISGSYQEEKYKILDQATRLGTCWAGAVKGKTDRKNKREAKRELSDFIYRNASFPPAPTFLMSFVWPFIVSSIVKWVIIKILEGLLDSLDEED